MIPLRPKCGTLTVCHFGYFPLWNLRLASVEKFAAVNWRRRPGWKLSNLSQSGRGCQSLGPLLGGVALKGNWRPSPSPSQMLRFAFPLFTIWDFMCICFNLVCSISPFYQLRFSVFRVSQKKSFFLNFSFIMLCLAALNLLEEEQGGEYPKILHTPRSPLECQPEPFVYLVCGTLADVTLDINQGNEVIKWIQPFEPSGKVWIVHICHKRDSKDFVKFAQLISPRGNAEDTKYTVDAS